ncbi:MAG TPA: M3 family peptidase [Campylobacterales bacterium]|nr:M3 family peptidase [Campylobacterales bacterium]
MDTFPPFPKNPLENGVEKVSNLIERNRKEIERLLSIENKRYANFLKPLEELERDLDELFTPIYHIHSVQNSEESQKVYTKLLPILSEYSSDISQDERIFRAVKEIKEKEWDSLNLEQQKVIENYLLDFKLSGVELDRESKERLKEIDKELSQLSNQFSQNVLDDTNSFEMVIENFEDVKEIPQSDLESAKIEDGRWKFTLQMPSYLAYITYGSNRELREKIYRAYVSRGKNNSELIDKILKLRNEKAQLLGFSNYAQLSLATKMASSTDEVVKFLYSLADKSKEKAKEELEEIRRYSGLDDFQPFDLAYYSEKYRKEFYDIDEEAYRPYFEKNRSVKGILDFIGKLFNLQFHKADTQLWDEKAEAFDVVEDGKVIARLYLDLEARENKKSGAWMNDWHSHHVDSKGKEHLATAFVVCNFPPSSPNSPSLLRHDDIHTLLHEMGHAIHHLLSRVGEISISGTNGVEWDAVEFPSQFLENFSYSKEVLKSFAKHYQTGEPLPDEMIDRLIKAKNFQSALQMVRQLEFGLFDFKLHLNLYQGDEVQNLLDEIRKEISPLIPPKYNKFQNSFTHIFSGGYSAGYYSYKWAEVLSADLFYQFVDRGIFDKEISSKYRDIVLAKGGTQSMKELFFQLVGREPDETQLLRLSGIVE